MARSPRQIVRSAVGVAAVAPAIALLVLAVWLMKGGGVSGVLAGVVITVLALALMAAALLMTHAPVTIANLLSRTEASREERGEPVRTNGHGSSEGIDARDEVQEPER